MSKRWWTRRLFLPFSQISKWTTDTKLVLRTFPGLLVDSKSLSPPSSLCLLLSLEYYCHKISSVDTGNISQLWEASKPFPNIFPPFYDPPSKIESVFQQDPLCRSRDLATWDRIPSTNPIIRLHCDPLTTSCELCSIWLNFWFRDKIFQTTFTTGLHQ